MLTERSWITAFILEIQSVQIYVFPPFLRLDLNSVLHWESGRAALQHSWQQFHRKFGILFIYYLHFPELKCTLCALTLINTDVDSRIQTTEVLFYNTELYIRVYIFLNAIINKNCICKNININVLSAWLFSK